MRRGRFGERGPDLPHLQAAQPHARLDQGNGVAAAPVAQVDQGPVEAVEQPGDRRIVTGVQGPVEDQGDLGREGEHGGGVEPYPQAQVRGAGEFRGGQPVEVEEALVGGVGAHGADDPLQQVEVAQTVLEADDARRPGQFDDGFGGEDGVVALVDDDGKRGGRGDGGVVPQQPFLFGDDEIGRHGQQAVGAGFVGDAGEAFGERGAVARSGDDRDAARRLRHGGGDTGPELLRGQRVELPGAAAGEDGGRARVDTAAHMRPEGVQVHGAVRRVRGHGEEQQSVEAAGERRGWGHGLSLARMRMHSCMILICVHIYEPDHARAAVPRRSRARNPRRVKRVHPFHRPP